MATLRLVKFRCVVETDESGADSPYFVFFIGRGTSPDAAQLIQVRKTNWDNAVSTGELFEPHHHVSSGVDSGTVVLCALMEEDDDADITPGTEAFIKVRDGTRTLFKAFSAGGTVSVGDLGKKLLPEFRGLLNAHKSDDEIIGAKRIPTDIDLKQHGSFSFSGDGGKYSVWFDMV